MSRLRVQNSNLYVHAMGHFHPSNVIDNQFLESLEINTNNEWIMERVGIRTRRSVLPLEYIRSTKNLDVRAAAQAAEFSNAQTAQKAAEMALENSGLKPGDIGLVIAGGCSPDVVTPAESARIASLLGIEAECFDLNAACSSFGAQAHWLSCMQPESLPDFILLVSPENNTRTIDYSDRNNAVLWGDGTSAAIVSPRRVSRMCIVETAFGSNPAGWEKVLIPRTGHFKQQGSAVQAFAIRQMSEMYQRIDEKMSGSGKNIYFIGHQANLRMLESVCQRCQIAPERHLYNVDRFGNTGAAGAPIVLSENWQQFKTGDVIALIVVGAGLSWASVTIEVK